MPVRSSGQIDARNPIHSARGLFQLTRVNYYLNLNGEASFGNGVEEALRAHSMAVTVEFADANSPAEVRDVLASAPSRKGRGRIFSTRHLNATPVRAASISGGPGQPGDPR